MKKRNKIIVAISVLTLVLAASAYLTYSYFNPEVAISAAKPMGETEDYVEMINVGGREHFFHFPKSVSREMEEVMLKTSEAHNEITAVSIAPTNIKVKYEERDGKTIITFYGTLTSKNDNTTSEYKKELVFDFIMSRNIVIN